MTSLKTNKKNKNEMNEKKKKSKSILIEKREEETLNVKGKANLTRLSLRSNDFLTFLVQ